MTKNKKKGICLLFAGILMLFGGGIVTGSGIKNIRQAKKARGSIPQNPK